MYSRQFRCFLFDTAITRIRSVSNFLEGVLQGYGPTFPVVFCLMFSVVIGLYNRSQYFRYVLVYKWLFWGNQCPSLVHALRGLKILREHQTQNHWGAVGRVCRRPHRSLCPCSLGPSRSGTKSPYPQIELYGHPDKQEPHPTKQKQQKTLGWGTASESSA